MATVVQSNVVQPHVIRKPYWYEILGGYANAASGVMSALAHQQQIKLMRDSAQAEAIKHAIETMPPSKLYPYLESIGIKKEWIDQHIMQRNPFGTRGADVQQVENINNWRKSNGLPPYSVPNINANPDGSKANWQPQPTQPGEPNTDLNNSIPWPGQSPFPPSGMDPSSTKDQLLLSTFSGYGMPGGWFG